jgi:hypothetical protein
MAEVILLLNVRDRLEDLIKILYDKEYFGFLNSSIEYVDYLYDFIYTIPVQKFRKTKNPIQGQYYCKYRHNRQTTWFFTFDIRDDRFLIRYVINNHTSDYPRFIDGII